MITTDTRLTITFFNQAAENLTGWHAADTYGRSLLSILRLLDEPTRQPMVVPLDQVVQQGIVTGLGEQTLLMRPDGFVRAIAGCATPIRDAQGQVQGLVLVARDITASWHVEGQLRQSQKLAAIGTLAGGIAHEFNNVLASIIGFTELTVDDVPPESRAWHNLQKVLQAGLRAKQVVQQLMAFSRQSPPVREPVQLDQIIREALTFLRASLPSTITLQYHRKPDGGPVLADRIQMHQVMMHLGANAADAMREKGGRLEVRLDTVQVPAETADTTLPLSRSLRPPPRPGYRVWHTTGGPGTHLRAVFHHQRCGRRDRIGPGDRAWHHLEAMAGSSPSAASTVVARPLRSTCPGETG